MKNILILTLGLLATGTLYTQNDKGDPIRFYEGESSIQSIDGTIKILREGAPQFDFRVNLSGQASNEELAVGFRGGRTVKASSGTLAISPNYEMSGKTSATQSLRVDLVPMINGKVSPQSIANSNIRIELPSNYGFIRANKDLKSERSNGGTVLQYSVQNQYLTPLVIVFNREGAAVSIEKTIQQEAINKGSVNFKLRVTNTGSRKLNNVLVEDNLDNRDFSGEGKGFQAYAGEENDQRLLWQSTIESLDPGESVELEYTVIANFAVRHVSLDAAKATVDGVLVGVSNKIRL